MGRLAKNFDFNLGSDHKKIYLKFYERQWVDEKSLS